MPHRVDAAMEAMKPLGAEPRANAGVSNAEPPQLVPRHDTVLAPRQRRQTRLYAGSVAFWVHLNP
jgi:hypothetical protein